LGIKASGYKVLLRTLEFMALGVGVSALATGILVYSGLVPAVVVEGSAVVAFFLTFVLWGHVPAFAISTSNVRSVW